MTKDHDKEPSGGLVGGKTDDDKSHIISFSQYLEVLCEIIDPDPSLAYHQEIHEDKKDQPSGPHTPVDMLGLLIVVVVSLLS